MQCFHCFHVHLLEPDLLWGRLPAERTYVSIQATWVMNLRNPVPAETRSGRAFE